MLVARCEREPPNSGPADRAAPDWQVQATGWTAVLPTAQSVLTQLGNRLANVDQVLRPTRRISDCGRHGIYAEVVINLR